MNNPNDGSSEHMQLQENSPLFCLPPELRNKIYRYAFQSDDGKHGWDNDHDCPKVDMLIASRCAPSNELLRTCRRIHAESRGFFIESQRDFWSNTTFTLTLVNRESSDGIAAGPVHLVEDLCNEQISCMAHVVISLPDVYRKHILVKLSPCTVTKGLTIAVGKADGTQIKRYLLDSVERLHPILKSCHPECLSILTYEQVGTRMLMPRRFESDGECTA